MSSAYDVERFFTDLGTMLKANLNNKLTAIDSEKGDYTIKKIDSSAWFFQSLNDSYTNFDPFVIYGVSQFEPSDDPYSVTATKMLVEIVIVVADQGQDATISGKMFRYQRALKEVILENFDSLPDCSRLKVDNQIPVDFKLINNSYLHKAIGVTIKADIG